MESGYKDEQQRRFMDLPRDEPEETPGTGAAAQKESAVELPLDSEPNEESKAPEQSPQVPAEPEKPSIADKSSKKGS